MMDGGSQHCIGSGDETIPKEKKCKKAKWLSPEKPVCRSRSNKEANLYAGQELDMEQQTGSK